MARSIYKGSLITLSLLPGCDAVASEWDRDVDNKKLLQAFAAADAQLTGPTSRFTKERGEKVKTVPGGSLWEFKGPPRGRIINRALVYIPCGWNMYIAFAGKKKSQKLPDHWIQVATDRVKDARNRGDLQ